jgi:MFS family permease
MPSLAARRGLNWLNFFTAAVQTGFGPFIAVYLTEQRWSQTDIGVALSIGTIAALISQLPAGMLVDFVHHKRWLTAAALGLLGFSALLLVGLPSPNLVWASQILHAAASGVLVPAIATLTLALYGHDAFSARLGMNGRYQSLGNAAAAALLGLVAFYLSNRAVFLLTALLVLPAIGALIFIQPRHYADPTDDHPSMQHPRVLRQQAHHPWQIFRDAHLHVFAVCMVLFSLSNTAMLPLALNALAQRSPSAGLAVSASIIVPQIIAAAISPWIGGAARRPVLLAGFLVLPLRGLLLATLPAGLPLALIQALDGVTASVLGIMVPLIAADLTRRTGYLNLAMNSIGLAGSIGATISTTVAGVVADRLGIPAALLGLALVGGAATVLLWLALPETRPASRAGAWPSTTPA